MSYPRTQDSIGKVKASIRKSMDHFFRLIEQYASCHSTLELDILLVDGNAPNYMAEVTEIISRIPIHKRSASFNLLRHSFSVSEGCKSLIVSHQSWPSLFKPEDFDGCHDVDTLVFLAKGKKVSPHLYIYK